MSDLPLWDVMRPFSRSRSREVELVIYPIYRSWSTFPGYEYDRGPVWTRDNWDRIENILLEVLGLSNNTAGVTSTVEFGARDGLVDGADVWSGVSLSKTGPQTGREVQQVSIMSWLMGRAGPDRLQVRLSVSAASIGSYTRCLIRIIQKE